jgi:prepilin-type N-terminal cleavage/methylation domain-containing protein
MRPEKTNPRGDGGFSLVELMIAMAVTLVVAGLASSLLASALNSKTRDDRRSDAIADARRALNIMSREIANAGAGLPDGLQYTPAGGAAADVPTNGIILVGNKGMTGARRFLLGSVPNKVSHHAPCSVRIVRTT